MEKAFLYLERETHEKFPRCIRQGKKAVEETVQGHKKLKKK